jgi:hypothetical protein
VLRSHDVAAVRSLAPQALAAAETAAYPELVGTAKASLAWLAWQDGQPQNVVALANEALEQWRTTTGWPAHAVYWVGLWPIVTACLGTGHIAEAVAAGRQMLARPQPQLPDELELLLGSAAMAWDQDEPELAKDRMTAALELAQEFHWF